MPSNLGTAPVAVVGAGVIGRSWVVVFARAGAETRVYDPDPVRLERAIAWAHDELERDRREGRITAAEAAASRQRIHPCNTLADALAGAVYVQESGPEAIDRKREIYAALDAAADPGTILGSSTSANDMSEIAAGLPGARRCIVAHPVNPPHVVPVVEVLAGRDTDPEVVDRTMAILVGVGQHPVLMHRYVPGFLLNRMQAALLREAIYLVDSGVASVEAVDAVISEGLGLRWALLGPFGVANTNADGGVREYFRMYGAAYRTMMNDLGPTPSFDPEMIERLGVQHDAAEGNAASVKQIAEWRDRAIRGIRRLREADPHPAHRTTATPELDARG